jgi:threonyl-tRNA synthetase
MKFADSIVKKLKGENIRAELDDRNETLQAKIRDAQLEKVPYMIIVGDREEKADKVAVRLRTEKDLGQMRLDEFINRISKIIKTKSLDL